MPGRPDDGNYDDSNRAFLQAFLSRSTMTFDTAQPILAGIFSVLEGREVPPNDVTVDDLDSYVSAANSKLSPLDMEIRGTFHQQTRERWYALVNMTSDPLTQLATTYSPEEIGYVKRILDLMFDGGSSRAKREGMCISGIDAIQMAKVDRRRETQSGGTQTTLQGLSMREAEAMMVRLVEEGWMEKSKKGFYSLSPRALMELRGWLVETYNDPDEEDEEDNGTGDKIKFCYACKEIITVGQRCPKLTCSCRLHNICTANFFKMQRGAQNCPICRTSWNDQCYVGEKAITTSDSYLKGKRRSTNQQPHPSSEAIREEE